MKVFCKIMALNAMLACTAFGAVETESASFELKEVGVETIPLAWALGGLNLVVDFTVHENWSLYLGGAYQDIKISDTNMKSSGFKFGSKYFLNDYMSNTPYIRSYYGYGRFTAETSDQPDQDYVGHSLSILAGYQWRFLGSFVVGAGAGLGVSSTTEYLKIYDDGEEVKTGVDTYIGDSKWFGNFEISVAYYF